MEPYLSGPVRAARTASVMCAFLIWALGLFVRFTTDIPQIVFVIIMALGFAPYVASLHVLEPRLMRRLKSHNDRSRGDSTDG